MAEVLSKSNLITPCIHHHHHHHRISLFPNNWNYISSGASSSLRQFPSLKLKTLSLRSSSSSSSSLKSDFYGRRIVVEESEGTPKKGNPKASNAQMNLPIGKIQKWWEKGLEPNMKEVTSAQDLVDSLLNAGDKLVVVDFFSPGCGGCKALHPKICQLAEMNPEIQFLQVNYEEHKSMCYSLNVHVLPFFRFYRGVHGRVCSFSCTNATIKKFKDALAKHSPDRCSLGPPKGLEEKELLALSANRDLSFTYTPIPKPEEPLPVPAAQEEMATAAAAHSSNSERRGPPKGLEEKELLALSANRDLSFTDTPIPKPEEPLPVPAAQEEMAAAAAAAAAHSSNSEPPLPLPIPLSSTSSRAVQDSEEKKTTLATAGTISNGPKKKTSFAKVAKGSKESLSKGLAKLLAKAKQSLCSSPNTASPNSSPPSPTRTWIRC